MNSICKIYTLTCRYLESQSDNNSFELSSNQLSNLIKFPNILYSLKFKYNNLIFKVKDANGEIDVERNRHSKVSNLFYNSFEDILKSKFCYKVDKNFI